LEKWKEKICEIVRKERSERIGEDIGLASLVLRTSVHSIAHNHQDPIFIYINGWENNLKLKILPI
jgi:hypothetical protein